MCPSTHGESMCLQRCRYVLVCTHNHRNRKGKKNEKKDISKLVGNNLLLIFPELAKNMEVVIHEFI